MSSHLQSTIPILLPAVPHSDLNILTQNVHTKGHAEETLNGTGVGLTAFFKVEVKNAE